MNTCLPAFTQLRFGVCLRICVGNTHHPRGCKDSSARKPQAQSEKGMHVRVRMCNLIDVQRVVLTWCFRGAGVVLTRVADVVLTRCCRGAAVVLTWYRRGAGVVLTCC